MGKSLLMKKPMFCMARRAVNGRSWWVWKSGRFKSKENVEDEERKNEEQYVGCKAFSVFIYGSFLRVRDSPHSSRDHILFLSILHASLLNKEATLPSCAYDFQSPWIQVLQSTSPLLFPVKCLFFSILSLSIVLELCFFFFFNRSGARLD